MVTLGPYEANTIACGHVLDVLRELPDECVHMAVTSPPYWGLRAYSTEPQIWGGESSCPHTWDKVHPAGYRKSDTRPGEMQSPATHKRDGLTSDRCSLCGAWKGELGLEESPEEYVSHLVTIFREVRRVLRSDGTLWLNLGASYASTPAGNSPETMVAKQRSNAGSLYRWGGSSTIGHGFKPKDLVPIPWMVAMALQADGWWLRSSIIWAKGLSFATHEAECPNCQHKFQAQYSGSCMPESCRDRPTQSYEYVFLLAKSKTYYYDQEAVREGLSPHTTPKTKDGGFNKLSKEENMTRSELLRKAFETYVEVLTEKRKERKKRKGIETAIELQDEIRSSVGHMDLIEDLRRWREKRR